MSYEVKADTLAASFDSVDLPAPAPEPAPRLAEARPALSGTKAHDNREHAAFVNEYLRKGREAGVQLKSIDGVTPGDGGYAIPREIDATIDYTLRAVSPIRQIANVVKVGSAGYRKLVTLGNTTSAGRAKW